VRERNIRDYVVFDLNSMSTEIIRLEITAAHFKFKPMMFQMLQIIGKFSSVETKDPQFHLRQFLEVASNIKILIIKTMEVYIDVVGKCYNFQNHLVKLEQVLKRMRLHGLMMSVHLGSQVGNLWVS